jgi:carboxypeptidase PM20D1
MKKISRLFRWLLIALFFMLAMVIVNTFTFESRQLGNVKAVSCELPDSLIRKLQEVVRIPTVSSEEGIDSSVFSALTHYLDSQFIHLDTILEDTLINDFGRVYRWPGKNARLKPILLLAHLDVVPAEEKRWTHPPFSGHLDEEGYVWGRGTLDDKVSALAILEAIGLLFEEGYQPQRSIYLGFGHDEEVGGLKGAASIASYFKEQQLEFDYVLDEGMVILEEAVPGLEKPVFLVGIGEKGYLSLDLKVDMQEGGHSSMPPQETTIGVLSRAIHRLESTPMPASIEGAMDAFFEYTGPEMPFLEKAVFANRFFLEPLILSMLEKKPSSNASVRTTMAPTIIRGGFKENALPVEASARLNFRLLPGDSSAQVIRRIKEIIDDPRVEVSAAASVFNSEASALSPTGSFGFRIIQQTAGEVFPEALVAPALVVGATDSRFYQDLSPNIYRVLPVVMTHEDLARIHGTNERIHIDGYKKMICFYRELLRNSCK